MAERSWKVGDRVLHTSRPEWGVGQVLRTEKSRHEGRDVQRLTIRFDRAGTKTISTAFATLQDADAMSAAALHRTIDYAQSEARDRLEPDQVFGKGHQSNTPDPHKTLLKLPEGATDPFSSLANRLDFTLKLYRFEPTGASLLDWAASQTQLPDPLSVFSRHELEAYFAQFRTILDTHLKKLVQEARDREPRLLAGLGRKVSPQMREMLARMLAGR